MTRSENLSNRLAGKQLIGFGAAHRRDAVDRPQGDASLTSKVGNKPVGPSLTSKVGNKPTGPSLTSKVGNKPMGPR